MSARCQYQVCLNQSHHETANINRFSAGTKGFDGWHGLCLMHITGLPRSCEAGWNDNLGMRPFDGLQ